MSAILEQLDKTLDFVGEGFKGLTSAVGGIAGDFTSGIKNFGLEVGEVVGDIGDVFGASFNYVEETVEFAGEFGWNTLEFIGDVLKDLIKLIPYLIRFLKSCLTLLKYAYPVVLILLFIAPALVIYYYTTYYVQLLERRY